MNVHLKTFIYLSKSKISNLPKLSIHFHKSAKRKHRFTLPRAQKSTPTFTRKPKHPLSHIAQRWIRHNAPKRNTTVCKQGCGAAWLIPLHFQSLQNYIRGFGGRLLTSNFTSAVCKGRYCTRVGQNHPPVHSGGVRVDNAIYRRYKQSGQTSTSTW